MNKSLDVIVNHTLATANELSNLRRDEWDRFGQIFTRMGEQWQAMLDIRDAVRGPAGSSKQAVQVNVYLDSKMMLSGISNAAMLAGIN